MIAESSGNIVGVSEILIRYVGPDAEADTECASFS